jgi:hypothetical protein
MEEVNMKKVLLFLTVTLLLLCNVVFSMSLTCSEGTADMSIKAVLRHMDVYQLDLTSDGTIGNVTDCQLIINSGYLYKVEVSPDSGGTQPTDLYDCTIDSPLGPDLMQGALQDLPNSNTTSDGVYSPLIGGSPMASFTYGTLSVSCSNMGTSKGTTMDLFFYKE